MKTKNSDIAVRIFLVVVGVILAGLMIAWSVGVFKDKKKDLNDGTDRINKTISSMSEFDLLAYDGASISGSLLLELIESKPDDVQILYITLKELKGSNSPTPSAYPSPTPSKSDSRYINPNGIFKGEVKRNDNGIIDKIIFTQQE